MKRELLLIRSNLRRAKGQASAIMVLMLLAAAMLNLWLMLSLDYKQNFDRLHEALWAEDVTLVADRTDEEFQEFLTQTLKEDARTKEFSLEPAMDIVGKFAYQGGEINCEFVILEKEAALNRQIGRVEIVEEWDGWESSEENGEKKSGVYLPMLYRSEEAAGSMITISIGSQELTYRICGFFNSIMAGSHNCAIANLLLTEDKYQELAESGYAPQATLCSVRLKDRTECETYEGMLKSAVAARYPETPTSSNTYALVSNSRYISQMICSGVISAMAFLILLIALVVLASQILHYIQENMKNLGTLKAIGYTGYQLSACLLVQFSGLSLLAAAAGIGLSYMLFPFLNEMMISQTGIPYELHFLPIPLMLTLAILEGSVALVAGVSARRLLTIEPITALRQGVLTHNFKKNHIPLFQTGLPLSAALAFKTTCSNIRYNLVICITMLVLSLAVVFSGLMVRNMIWDITPFLTMIVGETADSCININVEAEEVFFRELQSDKRVEQIYLYHSENVSHADGVELMATMSDDFSRINNQSVVFEGRFPRYENEIAIAARYAREKGLDVGEEIRITAGGREADYIISGFTQVTNNLGKDCLLTRAGYERLGSLKNVSYYLNLTKETDVEDFHQEIKERFGDKVNLLINIASTIEGAASVYVSLMTMIVVAILVLSSIVILFVLYLLVRLMISRKKREYGILKALGYTTGQLVLQTALSFMPAVILSAIAGLFLSSLMINPLVALFLNGIGIVKCTFIIPVGFLVAAGAGLVLFAFGTACLLSVRVRKISPKTLLTGE